MLEYSQTIKTCTNSSLKRAVFPDGAFCICLYVQILEAPLSEQSVDPVWMQHLDEHQQKQVRFAQVYTLPEFSHRTPGASDLTLISKLAATATRYEALLREHAIPLDLRPGAEDHA